jgi:prepilin-type N-terminal cleavage/methylation domain-containing protein
MQRLRKTTGFTLVEIMIVVLIIGLLLAIALPNFVTARSQSNYQVVVANLKQIDTAKQQFAAEKELIAGTVVNNASDLTPSYMEKWPKGPALNADYEANPIGSPPTYNGINATTLQTECGGSSLSQCPL